MQNKPNFQDAQMYVSIYLQTAYKNKHNWTLGENKPNSNPIKPNLRKAKMNVNLYVIEDYENETTFRPKKTNPNKPNFFKGQNELKIACRKIRRSAMAKHGSFLLALNRTMVNNS